METLLAILIGFLAACAVYSMLRRSLFRFIVGVILIGQAVNLLVFTSAGLTTGKTALIGEGKTVLEGTYADPLPQALVLTAIVIGFGLTAFCLALASRVYRTVKTDDLEALNRTES